MNFSRWITMDWPRKSIAFLCAFLTWYAVHRQIHEEIFFPEIPVTLELSESLTAKEEELPKVKILLSGTKKKLRSITNADIEIVGKLGRDVSPGRFYTIVLREKNVRRPSGINVVRITPDTFSIYIDRIVSKNVPIRCRFTGQIGEGYEREKILFLPRMAQLTGPSRIINDINEVLTEPIELYSHVQNDFDVEVKLEKKRGIITIPESINVTVEVYKPFDNKYFKNIKMMVLASDLYNSGLSNSSLPLVDVLLHGPKNTLDILTDSSLRAFIDISYLSAGLHKLPVRIWVAAKDCSVAEIKPIIVKVNIENRTK